MNKQRSSLSARIPTAPRSLVHLDEMKQRFGEQKIDVLIELARTGDAIADEVILGLEALDPTSRRQLQRGISQGLGSLDAPTPVVRAFLEEVESLPSWVDVERLKRGSEATLSIGNSWLMLSLGPGSLTHTYSSPSIASVLVRTGNLTKMVKRRLMETGTWHIASIMPGGLLRGADGYIHCLQVRLLHARVRMTLLKRGWDISEMGMPINQIELARTWLDFTYIPFRALRKFGITFTQAELADMYHFWQYVAYLLGIDQRLFRQVTDQQSAQELLELIDGTSEGVNQDSKALVQSMLETVAELLQMKLPVSVKFNLVSALTRRLHGNQLADQLGVKRTWVSLLLPLLTLSNRIQRRWNGRSSAARKLAVERTVKTFLAYAPLDGPTAYQRNANDPTQSHLPHMQFGLAVD